MKFTFYLLSCPEPLIHKRQNNVSNTSLFHAIPSKKQTRNRKIIPNAYLQAFFIIVPFVPSIASAEVITTCITPASTAEKAFSNLGIIPP